MNNIINSCLEEVSKCVSKFLKENGAYDYWYKSYVSGLVDVNTDYNITWNTPRAEEELTEKGKERKSRELYEEIRSILIRHEVKNIVLRNKDVGYGTMEQEVVYVEETVKRIPDLK